MVETPIVARVKLEMQEKEADMIGMIRMIRMVPGLVTVGIALLAMGCGNWKYEAGPGDDGDGPGTEDTGDGTDIGDDGEETDSASAGGDSADDDASDSDGTGSDTASVDTTGSNTDDGDTDESDTTDTGTSDSSDYFQVELFFEPCWARRVQRVVVDAEGDIIVGGYDSFYCDDQLEDAFLTHVSASGRMLRDKVIKGERRVREIHDFIQTDDLGYITVGMDCDDWSDACSMSRSEITRYDADVNPIWSLRVPADLAEAVSWEDNVLLSIIRLSDGTYATVGDIFTSDPVSPGTGDRHLPYLVIFNEDGEILQQGVIPVNDANGGWSGFGTAIVEARNGDLVVVGGQTPEAEGERGGLAVRVTRQMEIVWINRLNHLDRLNDVWETHEGDLIVTGATSTGLYVARLGEKGGAIRWEFEIFKAEEGIAPEGKSVFPAIEEGRFFITGNGWDGADKGTLIQMNTDGDLQWQRYYDSTVVEGRPFGDASIYGDMITDGVQLPDGSIVLAGTTALKVKANDNDPSQSIWILKVDADGNL